MENIFISQFPDIDTLGINSLADAIDWASRVVFIYQSIGWLKESFGKRIEKKPTIEQLEEYIRRAERWELSQLSLHCMQRRNC